MLAILLSSPVVSVVGTLTAAKSHLPLKDRVRTLKFSMFQEELKHAISGQVSGRQMNVWSCSTGFSVPECL